MSIKMVNITPTKEAVNFFGPRYLESNNGDYNGLFHLINMWKSNLYTVYSIQEEDDFVGLIHGWCRGDDFYGHIWFSKNYRGLKASKAVLFAIDRVCEDFLVDTIRSVVLDDKKHVRKFLRNIGFTNEKDLFTYKKG